jgi:hypothetical protein
VKVRITERVVSVVELTYEAEVEDIERVDDVRAVWVMTGRDWLTNWTVFRDVEPI